MRKPLFLLASFVASTLASVASAQTTQPGFQVDRFNPSERGSEWFALDTLDMRGNLRPAIGVVADYANQPFVLTLGSDRHNVVENQLNLHVGASVVVASRLRLGLNIPFAVVNTGGNSQDPAGDTYNGPTSAAAGDTRLSADLRLVGEYASPFTLAIGGQFFVPTGTADQYTGDNLSQGIVHLAAAGEAGVFAWAAKVGYHVRAEQTFVNNYAYGTALVYQVAAGFRLANHNLLIGPELYGEANTVGPNAFFQHGSTPVEAILGGHYSAGDWRFGVGAGPGITHDLGSPVVRVLGSIEWAPVFQPPPPPEVPVAPPADRDGDGVIDSEDACPDVPGQRTNDPKTNGCPDSDGDGVPDAQDACPTVPGKATDDPKTNGCPDTDGDGVFDKDDACPDVPGKPTDDPKTNGCPDKDGDGIVDKFDACPDVPGVKTDDPATNGCPPKPPEPVSIQDGRIKIREQVQFATGSARILPASDGILGAVAKVMSDHPEIAHVRVEGHTDNVGKAAMNRKLSQDRATSVMKWLTKHGIPAKNLTAEGFGMTRPLADNSTEEGRTLNRRVEFHIEEAPGKPAPPPPPGSPAPPPPAPPPPSP